MAKNNNTHTPKLNANANEKKTEQLCANTTMKFPMTMQNVIRNAILLTTTHFFRSFQQQQRRICYFILLLYLTCAVLKRNSNVYGLNCAFTHFGLVPGINLRCHGGPVFLFCIFIRVCGPQ